MGVEKNDRRQEIVFIGQNIKKHELIQALDACLLDTGETVSPPIILHGTQTRSLRTGLQILL